MPFVLSLDEGTTSARAALYDEQGRRVAMESAPITCRYPQPGWVEQDADESGARRLIPRTPCWNRLARRRLRHRRHRHHQPARDHRRLGPRAPAIPSLPPSSGNAAARPILRRTRARLLRAAEITRKTGLVIDAYFSASKIRWILENVPGARTRRRNGDLLFGNIDTWLIWKLTNGAVHVTDPTQRLAHHADEPRDGRLGRRSAAHLRHAARHAAGASCPRAPSSARPHRSILGARIPIAGIAGDQQAALAGQACFRAGLSKNTYGTGCFALLHTGGAAPVSKNRLLATRAASTDANAAVRHRRQRLRRRRRRAVAARSTGLIAHSGRIRSARGLGSRHRRRLFRPRVRGTGRAALGRRARGLITGLTRSTGRAHIVRAALESIAYQTRELVDAMEADAGARLEQLRVDGGAARNNFLMQFQADILGRPIVRPVDVETTALGAAYLAGLATGFWKGRDEVESFWRAERPFEPSMNASTRATLFDGWKSAVSKAFC